jgi:glucose-6-phosphate 1-epimerase
MFRRDTIHDLERLHSDDAEIFLQGAHLTRFRDWLYLSPNSNFKRHKAIRGGIPVVFPWFGPKKDDSDAPQHGWARTAIWNVAEVADDGSSVTLELCSPDTTAPDLVARLQFGFGDELEVRFEVENRTEDPFTFECALHTYFAVSDVRNVVVEGLDGKTYLDKPSGGARLTQSGPIRFGEEVDRVYLESGVPIEIRDTHRTIHVRGDAADAGWRSTVVWNPAAERAAQMSDLGAEEWPHFVCVESGAIADDAITLARDQIYLMHLRVSVEEA